MLTFGAPYADPNIYGSVNKLFKNQKAFFEKGERDVLKDRLEELLKTDASIYLGCEKELLKSGQTVGLTVKRKGSDSIC